MAQCETLRKDGSKCEAPARYGKNYCIFHDPEISEAEHTAVKAHGGELSRRPPDWVVQAKNEGLTFQDMAAIGFEILENERSMGQSPGVAAVMNSTLRLLIDLTELSTLGARLEQVEELLTAYKQSTNGQN